jgi:hypothetical protein
MASEAPAAAAAAAAAPASAHASGAVAVADARAAYSNMQGQLGGDCGGGLLEGILARFRQKSHVSDSPSWPSGSRKLDMGNFAFKSDGRGGGGALLLVEQLTEFLCTGKNRDGHAVRELVIL